MLPWCKHHTEYSCLSHAPHILNMLSFAKSADCTHSCQASQICRLQLPLSQSTTWPGILKLKVLQDENRIAFQMEISLWALFTLKLLCLVFIDYYSLL